MGTIQIEPTPLIGSLPRRASDRSATIGVGACGAPMAPAETLRAVRRALDLVSLWITDLYVMLAIGYVDN